MSEEIRRCFPDAEKYPEVKAYHDNEWGVRVTDDAALFEHLFLESFQSGLSWLIVLRKRENFRRAFDGFDPHIIAGYDEAKIDMLMQDEGLIRNRRKLSAAVNNARVFCEISAEFGSFHAYLCRFTDGAVRHNMDDAHITRDELSDAIAGDMKKRGMKQLGSVTVYSYLQAIGVINAHRTWCFRHAQLVKADEDRVK